MQKILLVSNDISTLQDVKKVTENVICAGTVDEAAEILKNDHDITTVLLEYPSEQQNARALIDHISGGNNYIFSISVLFITDAEHLHGDIEYLGGAAVDIIQKPIEPKLLGNRIDNAEKLTNSVSFNEFARMLKVLPANIYLKDANGRYVFSSQTWHHLDTGDDPNWTIRGKTDPEIRKDKENAQLAYESDLEMIRTGKGTSYIIEENDGEQEFLQLIKEPLFFEDGRVRGIIALINNVTEQELLRRKLKERSIHDKLTGIYNRGYLDEYIHKLKENGVYPICVISADCDRLKHINDTYGHMVGDDYIRLCVSLMKTIFPEQSELFRMGGDEFMAFIPGIDSEKAAALIGEVKDNFSSYTIKGISVSISLGFSMINDESDSIVECMQHSDVDMYRDKRSKKRRA